MILGAAALAGPAMAQDVVGEAGLAARAQDLSPWGMFQSADLVVKMVMIGLAIASVVTWTVWLAKTIELSRAAAGLRGALGVLEAQRAVGEAASDPLLHATLAGDLAAAAEAEFALSGDSPRESIKERIESRFARLELAAARRLAQGTGVLATIGATAPFVGLFGTVWGIMNSFVNITREQTTNLSIVAPGIAEALLATAIGLVAAIPAVVIYNHFSRRTAACRALMGEVSAAVTRIVSRELDRRDGQAGG
jgi:biopolymer transport protein ExbB